MVSMQPTKAKAEPVTRIISSLGKYNLLPQLQREVMIDNAISSIQCTPEEVEVAYQKIMKTQQIKSDQTFLNNCQHSETAKKQICESITRKLKITKFKQATWGKEVASYYISRKQNLDQVVYSEIVLEDEGLATEIYFRLLGKEQSFSELAFEHQKPEIYRVYEQIKKCPLTSKMAQLLVKHQPGELLRPINCNNVYRIIRFEQILPAILDESMHHQLLDELYESWLNQGCNDKRYRKMMLRELTSWTA
ncbi:MAG: peptidylprolyl isomerase [Cyanobacteria bacterium P01_C01_bin.72]